jgi:hypothetical protein
MIIRKEEYRFSYFAFSLIHARKGRFWLIS